MTTTRTNRNPISWLFKYNYQFVIAFFVPALILLACYFCFGVYPISNESVLSLDLNAQYVYYFDYMYDVFGGGESLIYSWSRNLSGEFAGIIGYYLASPFNFIVWAFPRLHITEGLLTMLLAKVGTIGLTTCIYLYRGKGYTRGTSVIFSMLYALCSYTMVQTMNPMWLDGVLALPLVIYGVESLVRKGRFKMLILSLIYSFVTCFYIGYMIGIFSAIYFFYYSFASNVYGRLDGGQILARMGLFLVSAVTSVLSSCFMLIPVVNSLKLGKFEFSTPDFSIVENFTLLDLFAKLLPNSYDTVRMEGLPFLYCGLLTVIMVVCYFLLSKIKSRTRIASAFLLMFMVICMYIRPVDMIWHGGQLPNWLPYRYSFMISFLLVIFAADAFEHLREIPSKMIGGAALFIAGMALLIGKFGTYSEVLERDTLPELSSILPAVVITAILAVILIQTKAKINVKTVSTVSLAIFVGAELFYNTITAVIYQDIDIVYSTRDSYVNFMQPTRQVVDEIIAQDDGFYRMEKNFNRSANDPIALRMYGLTHSSSTLNSLPIEMLGELGMSSRGHYTKYNGATPLIDDLFGIKYILSCPNNEYNKITNKNDITVEENLDAMPIMYLTDPAVASYRFGDFPAEADNVFVKQNRLLSNMLGEAYSSYIKTIPEDTYTLETENVVKGKSGVHTVYTVQTAGKNAQLKYTVTAQEDGEIFLWMPSSYERKLNVWLNTDVWKGNYYETENYNAKSLGMFAKGEEFTLTLTLTDDCVYFKDIFFGYFDTELYNAGYQKLRDMNTDTVVTKNSPTSITTQVNVTGEKLLFTTIPSEPGWTVTIDGSPVTPVVTLDSLLAVNVPEGMHEVRFAYNVPDFMIALALSGIGVMLFVILCVVGHGVRKKYGEYDYGIEDSDDKYVMYDEEEEEQPKTTEEKIEDLALDLAQINTGDGDVAFFEEETPPSNNIAETPLTAPEASVPDNTQDIQDNIQLITQDSDNSDVEVQETADDIGDIVETDESNEESNPAPENNGGDENSNAPFFAADDFAELMYTPSTEENEEVAGNEEELEVSEIAENFDNFENFENADLALNSDNSDSENEDNLDIGLDDDIADYPVFNEVVPPIVRGEEEYTESATDLFPSEDIFTQNDDEQ